MLWIVQCPCKGLILYEPRDKTPKRRRKDCCWCGRKFTITKPLHVFQKRQRREAVEVITELRKQYPNDHPMTRDPFKNLQRYVKKRWDRTLNSEREFSTPNDHKELTPFPNRKVETPLKSKKKFSHENSKRLENSPLGSGHWVPSNDHHDHDHHDHPVEGVEIEERWVEVDKAKITALFPPQLYERLIQEKIGEIKEGGTASYIRIEQAGCKYDIYTTGKTVGHLDSSREDVRAAAEGVFVWMGRLCGLTEVNYKIHEVETTLRVPAVSPLGKAIHDTIMLKDDVKTKMAIFKPNWGKYYLKEGDPEVYRVESDDFYTIFEQARQVVKRKLPEHQHNDSIIVINKVEEERLTGLEEQVQQTHQKTLQQLNTHFDTMTTFTGELTKVQKALVANVGEIKWVLNALQENQQVMKDQQEDLIELARRSRDGPSYPGRVGELIQIINFITSQDGAGVTVKEVKQRFGWSNAKSNHLLRILCALGDVVRTTRTGIPGRPAHIYRINHQGDNNE